MWVYSDPTKRFIRHRQHIQEVKTWFYCHWLLRYPLKCAPAVTTTAHFSGYSNMSYVSLKVIVLELPALLVVQASSRINNMTKKPTFG